jgi:ketosteroid isomerase-like protein
LAKSLDELLQKDAIRDQLYRYCRAVDRGDKELMRGVYHPDATDNHGVFEGKASDFVELNIDDVLPGLSITQHSIGNVLIELNGDLARVESYVLATHRVDQADGSYDIVVWGRYLDRFERRNGEWRIAHRQCVFDGVRNDKASASLEMDWCSKFRPIGKRGRGDPLYRD